MEFATLARSYYDALDDHDYDRLRDLLASAFVHDRPERRLEGRNAFVRFMREERPQTETTHDLWSVFENDDRVAVTGRLLDADGDKLFDFVDVHLVEDGRIVAVRTFT